ncbi:MAG: hypothetical protein OES79_09555, partial [Planctomycetota bacterium]|nr:hypothetical protein [Planctomycetota bacterium]
MSFFAVAIAASPVLADQPSQADKPYWTALQAVKYEPTPEDLLEHKKTQIYQSLRNLDQYLQQGGQHVVAAWQQYLLWPELESQLALPQPDEAMLARAFLNLRCNQVGLENVPFVAVRDSLHEYLQTARFSCPVDPQTAFDQGLERLKVLLARYERAPTREDARAIATVLACLQRSGPSARELVAAIRDQHDRPNAFARVSQRFLTYMMARDIDEQKTPINETKSGVSTRGTAYTRAEAKGALIPDRTRGTVDIRVNALTRAPHTISTAGPVTVYGSFVARTNVRKRLSIEENGLSFQPARANGSASVTIKDIVASRRIIEWIAQRRANRRLPETEDDIAENSSKQVRALIDKEVDRMLSDANQVYTGELRNPMLRYGAFPEQFLLSSSKSFLQLVVKLAKSAQLAAPIEIPELDAEHDLAFAVHASFFENFAELALADKSIADTQWLNFMSILTGDQPRPLWVHDRSKSWSFTFADRHPILVVLDGGQFTVTARGKRVTRGDTVVNRGVEV